MAPIIGIFPDFVSEDERDMLTDAIHAFVTTENWTKLKDFIPGDGGFMFGAIPSWMKLAYKEIKYDHSGASHALTMRNVQFLARHGWDNFIAWKNPELDVDTRKRLAELEKPYRIKEADHKLNFWLSTVLRTGEGQHHLDEARNVLNEILEE
jgi:hypothetical protein